jgi:ATP-dependent exoDNAse (exonuclease V) alpha subunit
LTFAEGLQQFRATFMRAVPPNSLEGIEKYLGSGLIKGIGPVCARKLVAKFGESVFDIIDGSAGRLTEVDGIGEKREHPQIVGFREVAHDDLEVAAVALLGDGKWDFIGDELIDTLRPQLIEQRRIGQRTVRRNDHQRSAAGEHECGLHAVLLPAAMPIGKVRNYPLSRAIFASLVLARELPILFG